MTLNTTSATVRPYGGRDEDFALAMQVSEDRAAGVPLKAQRPGDSIGITRDGFIVCRDGTQFPADDLSPERLAHLPVID